MINITQGGEYTNVVEPIQIDTDQPVLIRHSKFVSPDDFITSRVKGSDITVESCEFESTIPTKAGVTRGRAVDIENSKRFIFRNNLLKNTTGLRVKYATGEVVVEDNFADCIDGRLSDGKGGFVFSFTLTADLTRQFIILRQGKNLTGGIRRNWIRNRTVEGFCGLVEDVININSSGRQDSPFEIAYNLIEGAYNQYPASPDKYTGGGIIADGSENNFINIFGNVVLGTANYGISFAGGNNVHFFDNEVISSALLPNGEYIGYSSVGLSFQLARSANSSMKNNRVAWMNTRPAGSKPDRKDLNFDLATPEQTAGNVSIQPEVSVVPFQWETEAAGRWKEVVGANTVYGVGSVVTPPPTPTDDYKTLYEETKEKLRLKEAELAAREAELSTLIGVLTDKVTTYESAMVQCMNTISEALS